DAFAMRHEALDGFLGAAHALHLVAQVAVMAESRDLLKSVGSGDDAHFAPTLYLYDNYPGGVGLSAPLYERRGELVAQARAVVAGCDCQAGCPACVGPILEADEDVTATPRALALRVLDLL